MSVRNLSIQVSPVVSGTGDTAIEVSGKINSYSHKISASGGFLDARFDISVNKSDAEQWLDRVGDRIQVHSEGGILVWEGFIDKVSANIGGFAVARGPLMDVGNRVYGTYSTPSYTIASVTIGGDQGNTPTYDNDESIALYGVLEEVLSVGTASDTEAEQATQTWLADNAFPSISQSISVGGSGQEVSVDCVGYYKYLSRYTYTYTATNSTQTLDAKIKAILAADPNTLLSDDYSNVDSNATVVNEYEDENSTALDLINNLVSLGDSSLNRYVWGVYEDGLFYYNSVPTGIRYRLKLVDKANRIVDEDTGSSMSPWDIRPGQWLRVGDLGIGEKTAVNLRSDPRAMLIETVNYTAPSGIQLQGGKSDTITQRLARLSIGGIPQS